MMSGEHLAFILGSYAAAFLAIGSCLLFVLVDYRAQVKKLAAMEAGGLYRRSQVPTGSTSNGNRPDWDVN